MYITDKNYNERVVPYDKNFALFFISKTCIYCKPIEKMLKESNFNYKVFFVKAEESELLLKKFNIRAFPSMYFFKDRKTDKILIGNKIEEIKEYIKANE